MAAELVETTRLWARDVAAIKPEWAEELAGDIAKRSYSEPHWSSVGARPWRRRRCSSTACRSSPTAPCCGAASTPRTRATSSSATPSSRATGRRTTRSGRRTSEPSRKRRRSRHAPATLAPSQTTRRCSRSTTTASLQTWSRLATSTPGGRTRGAQTPELLTLTLDDRAPRRPRHRRVPDTWIQGDVTAAAHLPVRARLRRGRGHRARAARAPALASRPDGFDWLVPGRRLDLVTATIRALPKPVRRQAGSRARRCARHRRLAHLWVPGERSTRRLRGRARALADVEIPSDGVGRARGAAARALAGDVSRGGRRSRGWRRPGSSSICSESLPPKAQEAVAGRRRRVGAPCSAPRCVRVAHAPARRTPMRICRADAGRAARWVARDLPEVIEGSGGVRGYPAIVDDDGRRMAARARGSGRGRPRARRAAAAPHRGGRCR